jgi:hypothetical protein
MSRGVLARVRDDLAKADPDLEGDCSIWADEVTFLHQALYDALDDLDSALNPRDGAAAQAKGGQPEA